MTYGIAKPRSDGRLRWVRGVYRPDASGASAHFTGRTFKAAEAMTWRTQRGAEEALTRWGTDPEDGVYEIEEQR